MNTYMCSTWMRHVVELEGGGGGGGGGFLTPNIHWGPRAAARHHPLPIRPWIMLTTCNDQASHFYYYAAYVYFRMPTTTKKLTNCIKEIQSCAIQSWLCERHYWHYLMVIHNQSVRILLTLFIFPLCRMY